MIRKLLLVFSVLVLCLSSNAWTQVPASQDVGGPALAGSASYDDTTDAWTVVGGGNDIWGSWDQFHYVFRPLAGDGEGIVRVASMDVTHEWAKVGVMIRETLDGNSKHAMISFTGTHGTQTAWREETGGSSQSVGANAVLPWWLKITRVGDTISTFISPNGLVWVPQQVMNIPMNTNVYIGMFVCSHQGGQLCTTVFDNVTLTAPPYMTAWNLSPPDGTENVSTDGTTLSWMPGDTAATHDVYFGTTDPPELVGNQAETSYDTGALLAGTTYFWQIDEVEADGTTKHPGSVQSFSTIAAGPGKVKRDWWLGISGTSVDDLRADARYPDNPDGSDFVDNFEGPSDWADNYGTRLSGWLHAPVTGDYTFWIAADDFCELWLSTTDAPADAVLIAYHNAWTGSRQWDNYPEQKSEAVALTAGQLYYIEALMKEGGGGDNVSAAWQIPGYSRELITGNYVGATASLPLKAYAALPPDGSTLMPLDTTLSWLAGATAASHDVYFGTTDPPEFVGNQTATGYDPGLLAEGTVYYWQVNEVEADGVTIHTGDVMNFKTTRLGVGSITREVWEGIGGTAVSDLMNNANYPYNPTWSDELTSMRVTDFADNFGSRIHGWLYPETSGDYTFWESADDDCSLYLSTSENPADAVRIAYHVGWTSSQQWDKYAEQQSAPISLEANTKYYISVLYKEGGGGDNCAVAWEGPDSPERSVIGGYFLMPYANLWAWKPNPGDGATGVAMTPTLSWEPAVDAASYDVYLDGVLATNTTETSYAPGDLILASSHNWQVNVVTDTETRTGAVWSFTVTDHHLIDDFSSYEIDPVPPDPAGLVAHWEFEGNYDDSSGNGNTGTPVGDITIETDPERGQVVKLPGGDNQFVDCGSVGISGNMPRTIACWAKADHTNIPDWTLVFGFTGTEDGQGGSGSHFNIGSIGGPGGIGAHCWGWEETILSDQEALDWHHYAMTYDGTTIRYYADGAYKDTDTGKSNVRDLSISADRVHIGSRITQASSFPGMVDDARIYNYMLSEAEVASVAGVVPTSVITDNWSEWGFVDLILDAGTMKVEAAGMPGLPYFLGEARRTMPLADLTKGDGRALSIWFRGNAANVTEFMYAALSDGAGNNAVVLYDGDPADLSNTDWKEWNIDMKEFAGVDITNADELAIGLAGLDGSAEDALNFDNIRVYTCRCMPDVLKPYADLNRDCKVDLDDVQIMADTWGLTPDSWLGQDVGNPIPGSDSYDAATGTFTITANGHDIWDNADDFRYVYKQIEGDCEIVARVTSIGGPSGNEWRKAGVMIRQSLDAGSTHRFMPMTAGGGNGASFQGRPVANAGSNNIDSGEVVAPPYWVKLERVGNDFNGSISPDGITWTQLGGAETIEMTDPVYIGLAVTSHESGLLSTCELDNVSITGNVLPAELVADLNDDDTVGWQDLFIMLDEWLDERLWPEW